MSCVWVLIRYMIFKTFFPVCGLEFHFLHGIFWSTMEHIPIHTPKKNNNKHIYMYMNLQRSIIQNSQNGNIPNFLHPLNKQDIVHPDNGILFRIKKKIYEVLIAAKRLNLKNIMLSERNHFQKTTYCIIILKVFRTVKFIEIKYILVVA